jgi:glycosyltransferase involved in cell wall biosynthesis
MLYRYGLRHADHLIVQTRVQQQMIRDGFGRESTVIPMPCETTADGAADSRRLAPPGQRRVLWVGRFSGEKRLEWLLELARRCPDLGFDVVGAANASSAYAVELQERAGRLPNVVLHGRLPWAKVQTFYAGALCLCCTSAYEGFPNTFLEAWSWGTPVLSTVDPDGRVSGSGLGLVATNVDSLEAVLRRLTVDEALWTASSRSARRYFLDHHTLDAAMRRFEDVFRSVAGAGGRSRARYPVGGPGGRAVVPR